LKQVWLQRRACHPKQEGKRIKQKKNRKGSISAHLVGNRSLSGPFREITKTMEPRPLMGARSLPVQKNRNFFFCSKENE
jgi:hypothetical protein